jgi:hypothetical protein
MLLAINQNKHVQSAWRVEEWRRRNKRERLNFRKGTARTRNSQMHGVFRRYKDAGECKKL